MQPLYPEEEREREEKREKRRRMKEEREKKRRGVNFCSPLAAKEKSKGLEAINILEIWPCRVLEFAFQKIVFIALFQSLSYWEGLVLLQYYSLCVLPPMETLECSCELFCEVLLCCLNKAVFHKMTPKLKKSICKY